MKLGSTSLFPISILVFLAALTFWLERATELDNDAPGKQRHDPDYIVDNFTLKRFNAEGKLQHTLIADHMTHFPDDDSTEVTNPRVTYHSLRPTKVTADFGHMNADGKEVKLERNVRIEHAAADGGLPTVITTSVMYVYPDEEVARTQAPVVITQGQTVIHGTGLEANNKSKIGVLQGRVRGTIEPHR